MPIRVQTVQTGLEKSIRNAVKKVNATGGLSVNINDRQFTRPLGKITGSVSEFNKSLEASNARVLAFGASVGIIQSVQKAFAGLIRETINVEKKLADINVVMGITNQELNKFGDGLFKVARNTAQSFNTVAVAATELARQGLSMEETLKRTNDALILTRLTGLDAANAVSGLTAALNTFNKAGLDSTKILSKMAAVDVQFAVSTEDLIDAVSRAGAVAQDAGVSFDELLGAVTAAQQQTARGGKVIGNSFKTIFTRVQRGSTIKRLEELGIAVRDVRGQTLPAIQILTNLSKTYETLADTTKAAVAEQVGGVFQINILKAAIKDLGEQNSILTRATRISSQATDEAIKKNELLNKTLSALTSQAATSIQEFAATVGGLAFEDNLRAYLSSFQTFVNFLNDGLKQGEGFGSDLGRGLIKGFGNVISGPGMVLAIGILGKLLFKTFAFLGGSVKELLGIVSATKTQRDIQKTIVGVLAENSALQKKILSQEGNRAAQERTILSILQAQAKEQARIAASAAAIAPAVMRSGYNAQLRRRSAGHIPNYVSGSEAKAEKAGARSGGYSPGSVKSMNMPGQGRVVYNSAEKVKSFPGMVQPAIMPPPRSRAGKNYQKAFAKTHGFNPYASGGFVPNFARRVYSGESPTNIARALIHGKSTAMNLNVGGGRRFKDTFHSFGPAMATGTEMNAIRERIYKQFIQNKGSDFRNQVNDSLRRLGGGPKEWGNRDGDLIFGMVSQLNSARKSSRKLELPYSKGFVPNFGMRLNANKIKSIVQGKIHSDKFDGTIGMSELDKIITNGLFKSIKYRPKSGDIQDLIFTGARHGVHAHKKGAKPPKGFSSWADFDKNSPLGKSRVVHASSAGQGAGGYRRLYLDRIDSLVSQGKHLKVDPNMANFGFVPNYSAFHYDKNFPLSMPQTGDRITFLKALEFMPEHKLAQAMDMFLSNTQALDMKGSYPGMPIKDFKKHFGGSLNLDMGIDYLSEKRKKEILKNPDVMKSFFRYLTGKSSSIGIEAALTGDERKHFMSKYGMIPRMKSIDDGLIPGQKKKDRLSLIREDFLRAGEGPEGGKKGSVRGYIQEAFKQSRGSKNFNKLLAQNQAMAPPPVLGLPFNPDRGIAKARPIGGILAQMYMPTSSSFRGGGGLGGPGSFGALSGRFRGDDVITRRGVDAGLRNVLESSNRVAAIRGGGSIRDLIPAKRNQIDMAAIERLMVEEKMTATQAFRALGLDRDPAYQLKGFIGGQKIKIPKTGLAALPTLDSLLKMRRFRSGGFVPNFSRPMSKISTKVYGERNDALNKVRSVEFISDVGGRRFTNARTIEIPDPIKPLGDKMGLQVINVNPADKTLRGKGYGKELYTFMADYARKKGYSGLYGDMGTSPSAMRVVDSIAKGGKFNVTKNKDLNLVKDDFLSEGAAFASDSWTYRIANGGHIPNFIGINPAFANFNKIMGGMYSAKKGRHGAFGTEARSKMVFSENKQINDLAHMVLKGELTLKQMTAAVSASSNAMFKNPKTKQAGMDLIASYSNLMANQKYAKMMPPDMLKSKGFIPNFSLMSPRASGVLSKNPQFASAVGSAISREASYGVTPKVVAAPSLKSPTNPGLAVVNKEQEGGKLANARKLHGGLNPRQGASGGFIPNYAPIDPLKLLSIMSRSEQNVQSLGLRSLQNIQQAGARSINLSGFSLPPALLQSLEDVQKQFGHTAKAANQAAVTTKILNGTVRSLADRKIATQILRNERAMELSKGGGVAAQFTRGGVLDEERLRRDINIAKQTGDTRTLKQLQGLDKSLTTFASNNLSTGAAMGREAGKQISAGIKSDARREIFKDTKGFSKSQMQQNLSKEFLKSVGVVGAEDMNKKQAQQAMSSFFKAGGVDARNTFSSFAQQQGVKSSVSSLAKGGLASGELRSLTGGNNASRFIRAMNLIERGVAGGASQRSIKAAERLALREAAKATEGRGAQATQRLNASINQLVDEQKRQNQAALQERKTKNLEARRNTAQQQGRFMSSAFLSGRMGERGGGTGGFGSRMANLGGRFMGGASSSLTNFASSMKGFGGMTGMALSFGLPMIGGMVGPTTQRIDRAQFQDGQFRITDQGGRERAGSTLMGAGIGALFGLPGLIAGAAVGFAASASKMTLSIQEIIQLQEKQLKITNRNINSVSTLTSLNERRAAAFASGDQNTVNQIDVAINRALSQVTDPDILGKILVGSQSKAGLAKVQGLLQDRISQDQAVQNFGVNISQNNAAGAATSLANLIDQRLRSGEITGGRDTVLKTLMDIRTNLEKRQALGTAMGIDELNEIRRTSEGKQGTTLAQGAAGLATTGIIATGIGMIPHPLARGLTMFQRLMTGAAVGVGAGSLVREAETQRAKTQIENLGEDPLAATDALARLRDATIITENQFKGLSAAFNAGVLSFAELEQTLLKQIENFEKFQKNQESLGQQTFNLERSFKKTIKELKQSSELRKINEGSRIKRESSILDFSSRFNPDTPQQRLGLARRRLNLFDQGIDFRRRSFNEDEGAALLQSTKQIGKQLNLTPNLTLGLIDTVREGGTDALQRLADQRRLTGSMDVFGGKDSIEGRRKLFEELQANFNDNTAAAMQAIGDKIGTDDRETIDQLRGIIQNAMNNPAALENILSGDDLGTIKFSKEITEQTRLLLQDILDGTSERRILLEAQILADRKQARLSEATIIVQKRVNDLLSERASATGLQNLKDAGKNQRDRAEGMRKISGFQFEATDTFRGSRTEKKERGRQLQLQKQIFEEELKIQERETATRLKSEARKLLSDQKLVFALNKLGNTIEETIRKATDQPATSTTAPSASNNVVTTSGPGTPITAGATAANNRVIDQFNKNIAKNRAELDSLEKKLGTLRGERQMARTGMTLKSANVLEQRMVKRTRVHDHTGLTIDAGESRETDFERAERLAAAVTVALAPDMNFTGGVDPGLTQAAQQIQDTLLEREDRRRKLFERGKHDKVRAHDKKSVEVLEKIISGMIDAANISLQKKDSEINAVSTEITNLSKLIDKDIEGIQKVRKNVVQTVTNVPDVLTKLKDLSGITIDSTDQVINAINALGFSATDVDKLQSQIHDLKGSGELTKDQLNLLSQLEEAIINGADEIRSFAEKQNFKMFTDKFVNITKNLQFLDESMGTFRGMEELREMDTRQSGASRAFRSMLEQDTKQKNLETLMADPTATRSEIASAKIAARSQTIGTVQQRDELKKLDQERDLIFKQVAALGRDTNISDEKRNEGLETAKKKLEEINESMVQVAEKMTRTTPRDQGIFTEIGTNLPMGLEKGFADLQSESEQIYTRLGEQLPFALRNGLVDAMQAALEGADNLGDTLKGIGIGFLQIIQRAFLESAASRIVGVMGLNSGGMVTGGSGVRDDVPAMLTGGEYVIKKSSVDKYGMGFMDKLNRGMVPGYAEGGAVDMNIGAPRSAKRESFVDKNKYGNITRYKDLESEIGINSKLTGFARANDRKILEYFREQENQFREDLATKDQEKQRAETRKRVKEQQKNALIGVVAGIAGGALLSKAVDLYKGTDFAKRRAEKRAAKQFNKQFNSEKGSYTNRRGRTGYEIRGQERRLLRQDIDNFKGQGATASQMREFLSSQDVQFRMDRIGVDDYEVTLNRGGRVPTMLTGGEYIMSPKAVRKHGSAMMNSINNGTYAGGQGSGPTVSHGDVNISINVDNNGMSSEGGNQLNTKEFSSKVKAAVMQVINQEKRVGGSLR